MTDYQIITIILSLIGILVTVFALVIKVLMEWVKDKNSKK